MLLSLGRKHKVASGPKPHPTLGSERAKQLRFATWWGLNLPYHLMFLLNFPYKTLSHFLDLLMLPRPLCT